MADTFYAWSNITKEADPSGRPAVAFKAGDKVSKTDFPDDDWEYFVNSGVVRTTPYPDLSNFDGSPNDFYRQKLAAVASLDTYAPVTESDVNSLKAAGLLPAGAEEASATPKK